MCGWRVIDVERVASTSQRTLIDAADSLRSALLHSRLSAFHTPHPTLHSGLHSEGQPFCHSLIYCM